MECGFFSLPQALAESWSAWGTVGLFALGVAAAGTTAQAYYRAEMRRTLNSLITPDIVAARNIIGVSARVPHLNAQDYEVFRAKAFLILWTIQHILPAKNIFGYPLTLGYAQVAYGNLDQMVAELSEALKKHGSKNEYVAAIDLANIALDRLPPLKTPWSRTVYKRPSFRINEPPRRTAISRRIGRRRLFS